MTFFLGNHDRDTSFCKIYILNFVVITNITNKVWLQIGLDLFLQPITCQLYICNSIKKVTWLKLHTYGFFNPHIVGWKKITLNLLLRKREYMIRVKYSSRLRRWRSSWLHFSLALPFSIITEQRGKEKLSANVYLNNFNCYIIIVSPIHIKSISYCNILCSHMFHAKRLQISLSNFFFSSPFF